MNTRQCYWCAKTVDKTVFFCSEKCRYEYNNAKGTNQEMYDFAYRRYLEEQQPANNRLGGCLLVLLLDFLLFLPVHFLIEGIYRYYKWAFWTPIYMPIFALMLLNLVGYGIYGLYLLVTKMRG
jgi:hypothetical protein